MKKNILVGPLLIFILLSAGLQVSAQDKATVPAEIISDQLANLDLVNLEQEYKKILTEVGDNVAIPGLTDLIRGLIRKEFPLDFRTVFNRLWQVFWGEIRVNLKLLGQLLILAVIGSLLQVLQGAFQSEGVGQLTRSVTYLVLILIIIGSMQTVLAYGKNTIQTMADFMIALTPPLLAMLVGVGAVTSASIFQPVVFLGVTYMSNVVRNAILPMIFFSALLLLINGISKDFRISRLVSLIKEVSVVILGVILVIFVGLMALQGSAVAVGDALTIRTAKYLTGAFIPVFGSMFADTVELVAGCSLLIKNALGIVGLLGIIIITVFPMIKILAIAFIYKTVAAVIEPIGEENVAGTLSGCANIIIFLLLAVAAVSVMFFVCLTMIIGMGNLVVMLR